MSDALTGSVAWIRRLTRPFVIHEEHQITSLKITPVCCGMAKTLDVAALSSGVAGQSNASTVLERLTNKVGAIESTGVGAVGGVFIRRSEIFFACADDFINGAAG
jgi:hypothetical protein